MSLPPLQVEEFADYFRALWDRTPFPWQVRLAHEVCAHDAWPAVLDLPTAAGKTAAIDIAVFHLAWAADRGTARQAAVRIAFVVDRRLVVDSAHERAQTLAHCLADAALNDPAGATVLGRVAARLGALAEPSGTPLRVARLRGGMPKEPDWARTPAQPTVLISTVDQVGSRVLFRGYGVSDSMKPVHAGLLGVDTLLLLDEAHLSQPFAQTLDVVRRSGKPSGLTVVALSATPAAPRTSTFGLDKADRQDPTLHARLGVSKPAHLALLPIRLDVEDGVAAAYVEKALTLSGVLTDADAEVDAGAQNRSAAAAPAPPRASRLPVVAVVVNRVKRARAIFEVMRARLASEGLEVASDVVLLTGRVRDLDRDATLQAYLPRLRAGRVADPLARQLFVIATQCIEAGADLDFDALVTEIAPLDSLRQRFGRLNRLGRPINAEAVIVAAKDQVGERLNDAVYGGAPAATWAYLEEIAETCEVDHRKEQVVDLGVDAFQVPSTHVLTQLLAPRADAPVVLSAYLASWRQTSPIPAVDPEPALFLHGPQAGPAEVSLVWRADLQVVRGHDEAARRWLPRIEACPPVSLEALAVPIWEARRFLRSEGAAPGDDLADLEGLPEPGQAESDRGRLALRWAGAGDPKSTVLRADQVRPGDILVVPASYGGSDRWGWNPGVTQPVADLGELAWLRARGRAALRVSEAMLVDEWYRDVNSMVSAERAGVAVEAGTTWQRLLPELQALRDSSPMEIVSALQGRSYLPARWGAWLTAMLETRGRVDVTWFDDPPELILMPQRQLPRERVRDLVTAWFSNQPAVEDEPTLIGHADSDAWTEDDSSAYAPRRAVRLAEHSHGVASRARTYAAKAGLSTDQLDDLELAGLLHDAGKAEPCFQAWLRGGDQLAAWSGELLAKSSLVRLNDRAARIRAGLPNGARHEVGSVLVALEHPRCGGA